jgi:uncharacterized protein (DUF1499 family)
VSFDVRRSEHQTLEGEDFMAIFLDIVLIIIGLCLGLVILAAIVIFIQNRKPHIALGLENGKLREIPNKRNSVSTDTVFSDKLISQMVFKDNLENTKAAVKKALDAYGGIAIIKEDKNYIYAIATTPTIKFHDDMEIYFDEDSRTIHFRSASRAGYSDMGLNRERYNKIVKFYEQVNQ